MSLITLTQLEEACKKGQTYIDDIGEAATNAITAVSVTASNAYTLASTATSTIASLNVVGTYSSTDESLTFSIG